MTTCTSTNRGQGRKMTQSADGNNFQMSVLEYLNFEIQLTPEVAVSLKLLMVSYGTKRYFQAHNILHKNIHKFA